MRIFYTTDIHASRDHLATLERKVAAEKVDVLIIGGDIVPHDLSDLKQDNVLDAQAVYIEVVLLPAIERIKQRCGVAVFLDLGNDDLAANRDLLFKRRGSLFELLHMQKHELAPGIDLVGYMVVPPTPFRRKDWEKPDAPGVPCPDPARVRLDGYTTAGGHIQHKTMSLDDPDTIAADLAALSAGIKRPFVFAAHSPPWDTPLDVLYSGLHVGSVSIRRFIEHWGAQGLLLASLHGHIHESPRVSGRKKAIINTALCVNPGQNEGPGADLSYVMLDLVSRTSPPRIRIV